MLSLKFTLRNYYSLIYYFKMVTKYSLCYINWDSEQVNGNEIVNLNWMIQIIKPDDELLMILDKENGYALLILFERLRLYTEEYDFFIAYRFPSDCYLEIIKWIINAT